MATLTLPLANTTVRSRNDEEKDYREVVRLSVEDKSFRARLVSLHFPEGPELNFSTFDMDRIAIEYLKLRGIKPTSAMSKLLDAPPPPRCSFIVPVQHMADTMRNSNASSTSD
ncbi:hypothetical protein BH10PLA2_BH10PLA2_36710 [soil metagenome]